MIRALFAVAMFAVTVFALVEAVLADTVSGVSVYKVVTLDSVATGISCCCTAASSLACSASPVFQVPHAFDESGARDKGNHQGRPTGLNTRLPATPSPVRYYRRPAAHETAETALVTWPECPLQTRQHCQQTDHRIVESAYQRQG